MFFNTTVKDEHANLVVKSSMEEKTSIMVQIGINCDPYFHNTKFYYRNYRSWNRSKNGV